LVVINDQDMARGIGVPGHANLGRRACYALLQNGAEFHHGIIPE
jgi:hypothetical protein